MVMQILISRNDILKIQITIVKKTLDRPEQVLKK